MSSVASFYIRGLGRRVIDCLVNGHAFEYKTGAVKWTTEIMAQIAKDAALLARGEVKSVTWVFARNLSSGLKSVDPRVLEALDKAGITVKIRFFP